MDVFFVYHPIPDQQKSQETCDIVVSLNPFLIVYYYYYCCSDK